MEGESLVPPALSPPRTDGSSQGDYDEMMISKWSLGSRRQIGTGRIRILRRRRQNLKASMAQKSGV